MPHGGSRRLQSDRQSGTVFKALIPDEGRAPTRLASALTDLSRSSRCTLSNCVSSDRSGCPVCPASRSLGHFLLLLCGPTAHFLRGPQLLSCVGTSNSEGTNTSGAPAMSQACAWGCICQVPLHPARTQQDKGGCLTGRVKKLVTHVVSSWVQKWWL